MKQESWVLVDIGGYGGCRWVFRGYRASKTVETKPRLLSHWLTAFSAPTAIHITLVPSGRFELRENWVDESTG
jgi:hypothetical protein